MATPGSEQAHVRIRLGTIIKQIGPCTLADIPDTTPFVALSEAIASQQLSVKAADTIFGRFCDLFPDPVPDPARLLTLDDEIVRVQTQAG